MTTKKKPIVFSSPTKRRTQRWHDADGGNKNGKKRRYAFIILFHFTFTYASFFWTREINVYQRVKILDARARYKSESQP